ncbi:competence protein ComFA [Alkalihalobacillus xiaoxiensis]|uniref:Competence protein ComFA n=1 Tax=Shouchella xiaoxiensis TaxID=766895 RepID=A0ABS2T1T5_9BACI|nr:DEAD/DEAH box helicase family protein [Shouchella xiaoxiensis]MBM7840432.1 competence protein ComFA [Shouchella xiaoxiensis]
MDEKQVYAVRTYLNGRQMLSSEWPFSNQLLSACIEQKFVESKPAIVYANNHWHCERCGNHSKHLFYTHYCFRCTQLCTYCRHCFSMGKVSTCTHLLQWKGRPFFFNARDESCQWEGQLSPLQKKAATHLVEAVQQKNVKELIWAVCGAGKTEILFPAIEQCLRQSLRLCIATPRTDVVKELAPRLAKSFPKLRQSVLYADSRNQFIQAQLVLTTTHQLIRYVNTFDVLIIDEVDAFPYSYDKSLQFAVNKAKKSNATVILLSATPSLKLLNDPTTRVTKIQRRFHGKPLPLPRFEWIGNWQNQLKRKKIPHKILSWINHYNDKPTLLFFPSIYYLKAFSTLLDKQQVNHGAVFSEAEDRHELIRKFRSGQINLLLTTTILERGITIADVQVAVIGAEQPIFSEACLVQICGRVGRKEEFPTGDIVFWHYGLTHSMIRTKAHLKKMNKEGGV